MVLSDFWNPFLERCGFILKDGSIIEVVNRHENPQEGFRISTEDILSYEEQVVATWHTHPKDGVNLSVKDYECFLAWPQWQHIIAYQGEVALYSVEQNRVLLHDDFDLPRLSQGPLP